MKALKFITTFTLLLLFNFAGATFAQTVTETKTVETSDKITAKPVEKTEAVPVLAPQERYRIGLQDVLEITVQKHPALSRANVKMDEYGRIRMPRIERSITALCKTENELAREIRDLYAETVLVDPFVSVYVREQNSQPVAVVGAVKNPGRILTNRRMTLLEIISWAGGPDYEYAGNTVQVARIGGISGCADKDADTISFFSFKLPDILKGKTNPVLKPGDIVSVLDADTVYVYGNVNKEGQVKMREPITLLQAIVSAEGLKPASKNKVRVLRQKGGSAEHEELVFDIKDIQARKAKDPVLQPNDIVAVSEDPFKSVLNKVREIITNTIPNAAYRVP